MAAILDAIFNFSKCSMMPAGHHSDSYIQNTKNKQLNNFIPALEEISQLTELVYNLGLLNKLIIKASYRKHNYVFSLNGLNSCVVFMTMLKCHMSSML